MRVLCGLVIITLCVDKLAHPIQRYSDCSTMYCQNLLVVVPWVVPSYVNRRLVSMVCNESVLHVRISN